MNFQEPVSGFMERIAQALERLGPGRPQTPDFAAADAFVFQAETERFQPVSAINRVPLTLLKGIDRHRDILLTNTERFAKGLPANNALLWGARGMGKSSLIKAVHGAVPGLKLVEIHREDIASLPRLLGHLRKAPEHRFILFCDDLSFEAIDTSYKSLKAVLEGNRGTTAECAALRHLQPAALDAPRDGRERALHGHQPVRSGRGEALLVGPFRAVDRLPQLQPGRIPRHGLRLCGAL